MSVRVQTYVWQLSLTPIQKLVAIALADHCHDDGTDAFPSVDLLALKTNLNERTVRRTLHELLRLDVLMLQRKSGQHRPNCYMFPIPDGFGKLRPDTGPSLIPDRTFTTQTGLSRPSEGAQDPPNHKEPLVEPTAVSISVPMPAGFKDVFKDRTLREITAIIYPDGTEMPQLVPNPAPATPD